MQVNETLAEGLKREFQVVISATDLSAKADARLDDMKDRVRLPGFRPGKVPVAHLKRVYGRSVMAETIEQLVRETNTQIFTDRGFKLATEPKISMPEQETEIEKVLAGEGDLAYSVAIELIPAITLADFKTFTIDKQVADISDADVDDQIAKIAEQARPFGAKADGSSVEKGDRATISFKGSIDGVAFAGGTGEDIAVPVGSNTFIPGFEDQLIGMNVGETRTLKVTFPKNYGEATLAGKDAEFETTVTAIEAPQAVTLDDEFAKTLGLESFDKLKEAARGRLQSELDGFARLKVKRQLLDKLDEAHKFEAPPSLIDEEFNAMWTSVNADMASANRSFADDGTTEEAAREDYRKIADRRVRLGLVLAEIGEKNSIKVTDEEVSRALIERARQFPGQEKQVWDYYRSNPQALAQLRAPLYEDKVVNFILELANVSETKVSKAELTKDEETSA